VRVDVTRSGGYAGLTLHGTLDTETLAASERSAAEAALERVAAADSPPTGADRFQYDLAITDQHGATRRLTLFEPDVPAELRAVLGRVLTSGTPQR
jgi:hypothetical protein